MAVAISVPRDDSPQQLFERDRHLAAQRALYNWDRRPGLPPMCKGIPAPERFTRASAYEFLSDAADDGGRVAGTPVLCVDRFRSRLDDIAFAIEHRNRELPPTEQYTYLVPSDVGRSITI